MDLEEPPDDGPLLHTSAAAEPHFEVLNFGTGPVAVVNTSGAKSRDPRSWSKAAGAVEILLVFIPVVAGVLAAIDGAPPIVVPIALLLSLVIAVLGAARRRRQAKRLRRLIGGRGGGGTK